MSERDEEGWLIEHAKSEVSAPLYVFIPVERDGPKFDWTKDHAKALRFARKQDATIFAHQFIGLGDVRIAEHAWVAS